MVLAMGGLGGPAVAVVELHFQAGPVRFLLALFHQTPAIRLVWIYLWAMVALTVEPPTSLIVLLSATARSGAPRHPLPIRSPLPRPAGSSIPDQRQRWTGSRTADARVAMSVAARRLPLHQQLGHARYAGACGGMTRSRTTPQRPARVAVTAAVRLATPSLANTCSR